ncbi:MAG: acyl-CoA thioesterase [Flavobacteriales bacterium]
MKPFIFKNTITVPSSAIDFNKHVNNIIYLQWCVETAQKHWEFKASEKIRNQFAWIALHHEINYKAPSFKNELLEIQTWIEKYHGVKCERHYKIIRPKDNKTIIEAKTIWCLVDFITHKPLRIKNEIAILFQ